MKVLLTLNNDVIGRLCLLSGWTRLSSLSYFTWVSFVTCWPCGSVCIIAPRSHSYSEYTLSYCWNPELEHWVAGMNHAFAIHCGEEQSEVGEYFRCKPRTTEMIILSENVAEGSSVSLFPRWRIPLWINRDVTMTHCWIGTLCSESLCGCMNEHCAFGFLPQVTLNPLTASLCQ